MNKLKVGDSVKVRSGKDKGREGRIEAIFPKKGTVLVSGVNVVKKHVKGGSGVKSGIYDISKPLPQSSVCLVCPNCKKETRVRIKVVASKKARYCAKCRKEIVQGKKAG